MVAYSWIAAISAAIALLAPHASANPTFPRAEEDQASLFVDELVANLTEAAENADTQKRSLSCSQRGDRTVNLGYAKYQGYHDDATDLNVWKG